MFSKTFQEKKKAFAMEVSHAYTDQRKITNEKGLQFQYLYDSSWPLQAGSNLSF